MRFQNALHITCQLSNNCVGPTKYFLRIRTVLGSFCVFASVYFVIHTVHFCYVLCFKNQQNALLKCNAIDCKTLHMRCRHMRIVFCNPFYCILISAFCCYNAHFSSSPPWRANFREVCFCGLTVGPTIASLCRPTRRVTLWPTRLFIWNWSCMDRPFKKGNCRRLILLEGLWLVYVPPGLILNIAHFTSVHVF
jgi:hypothetical protein